MIEINQQDLSPLLNALHEGVCYLSAQGEILQANDAAHKHWELDKQHSSKLLLIPAIAKALAGEPVHHALIHQASRMLLLNTLPLAVSQGASAIAVVMIVSQDVSEQVMLQRRAEASLELLVEAAMQTQELHDTDEALRRIAALLLHLEFVDNCIAISVDEQTGRLKPLAFPGANQAEYEEWEAELATRTLTPGKTLKSSPAYMRSLLLKKPLMVDFSSQSFQQRPYAPRAALYAPVLLNGKAIGLLGAERYRPLGEADTYFPPWSLDLLMAMARLVSMSIERTSLINVSAKQQEEIETIRRLLSQKEVFLSLTAHELRNPLTAIKGEVQILQRRITRSLPHEMEADHGLLRGLNSIERQTQKIVHMVNALLDVSRLDLERLELELQEIDLVHLSKRTLEDYLPLARDHELRLLVNEHPISLRDGDQIIPHESMHVIGDEERLEQILINLISNAVKYSPAGSPVTVSLRNSNNGTIEIAVQDQGIGIPPEAQGRLTERFFRAQNARHLDAKGLGLGLYLVNELVARHGGTLTIASEGIPDKGSTFIVQLPHQQQHNAI